MGRLHQVPTGTLAAPSETAAMALDVPDLVFNLQSHLRAEAGISISISSAPDGPAAAPLPTLAELAAAVDPSAPGPRCGQCRTLLLRGAAQSTCCLYCGAHHHRDDASIFFFSTLACRGLLDFMHLNGSEIVSPEPTKEVSSIKREVVQESLLLSDLLSLELKWPKDSTKTEASTTKSTISSVGNVTNMPGADLDDFFAAVPPIDSHPDTFEESKAVSNAISFERSTVDLEGVSGNFESGSSSDRHVLTERLTNDAADSFSAWEADFQSAEPETSPTKTKTVDPFQDFPTNGEVLSVESFLQFDSRNDSQKMLSTSVNNSDEMTFDSSEPWNTTLPNLESNVGEQSNRLKESAVVDNLHADSKWSEVDMWSTFNSTTSKFVGEADEKYSFDVWQDIAGLGPVHIDSSTQKHSVNSNFTATNEQTLVPTGFSSSVEEFAFDGFPYSGHSAISSNNILINGDIFDLESFSTDRAIGLKAEPGAGSTELGLDSNDGALKSIFTEQSTSTDPNVEELLSQMHDLSFMLADELSIPEEAKGTNVES